jgi:NitT/TauT family transport system substrate-binding protein
MRRSRPRALLGLLLALSLCAGPDLLTGCAPPRAAPLRLGINPWPAWEFFYLAQELKQYQASGVEVKVVEFSSLGDAKRAFERGQVDAFLGTLVEIASTDTTAGRRPSIVMVTDYSNGADQILARAPIAQPADLPGKRVAVEFGSLNVFVLARALDSCAAKLEDVELVDLDQLSMLEAFRRGEVDAIVAYPPVSLDALKIPGTLEVYSSAAIPGEVVDVLAFDERIVRERERDVLSVCRAYQAALESYRRDPAATVPIMARREGVAEQEFEAALRDGIRLVEADEQADYLRAGGKLEQAYAAVVDVLRRTGQLAEVPQGSRIAHSMARRFDAEP